MVFSLDSLIRKVEVIADECAPEEAKKKLVKDEKLDEFTARKRDISQNIKAVRQVLKEREDLLVQNADAKKIAEMSQQIRTQLKNIREDVDELSALQKKEAKKARKKSPEVQHAIASRAEIVELAYQHLAECENWEKRRITENMIADRSALLGPSAGGGGKRQSTYAASSSTMGGGNSYDPTASNLQDITDYRDELQALRDMNKEIDDDIDIIADGVGKLKRIALDMSNEIEMQTVMIDEITTKVEKTGTNLVNLNRSLKKTLDGVMKGDKFIINFVLLLVLLAVIAFVASQFVS